MNAARRAALASAVTVASLAGGGIAGGVWLALAVATAVPLWLLTFDVAGLACGTPPIPTSPTKPEDYAWDRIAAFTDDLIDGGRRRNHLGSLR